jgi:hypothetical protein
VLPSTIQPKSWWFFGKALAAAKKMPQNIFCSGPIDFPSGEV